MTMRTVNRNAGPRFERGVRACGGLAAALLLAAPAAAQSGGPAGTWAALQEEYDVGFCATRPAPATARAMVRGLTPTLEPFRRAAPLAPPRGVEVRPRAYVRCNGPVLVLALHRLTPQRNCADCPPRVSPSYGGSVTIYANEVHPPLLQHLYMTIGHERRNTGHYVAPLETGRIAGLPVYEAERGFFVVVNPGGEPLWLPVSREEFLETRIREVEARIALAEANPPRDRSAGSAQSEVARSSHAQVVERYRGLLEQERRRLHGFQAELAALSPEQRRVQAWCCDLGDGSRSGLMQPEARRARPVVRPNPAHVAAVKTATEPRFLLVRFGWSQISAGMMEPFLRRLHQELDWAALVALTR
jgi:hypothetical protein